MGVYFWLIWKYHLAEKIWSKEDWNHFKIFDICWFKKYSGIPAHICDSHFDGINWSSLGGSQWEIMLRKAIDIAEWKKKKLSMLLLCKDWSDFKTNFCFIKYYAVNNTSRAAIINQVFCRNLEILQKFSFV